MNTPARLALLVSFSLMPPAQAEGLGRLFFTPTERAQLEQEHTRQAIGERGAGEQSTLTVNGLIKRSDGSSIVWINGKAQKIGTSEHAGVVPMILPGKKIPVGVNIGQRIVRDNSVPTKPVTESASNGGKP